MPTKIKVRRKGLSGAGRESDRDRPASGRTPRTNQARILSAQRLAGNAAVVQLLREGPSRSAQRGGILGGARSGSEVLRPATGDGGVPSPGRSRQVGSTDEAARPPATAVGGRGRSPAPETGRGEGGGPPRGEMEATTTAAEKTAGPDLEEESDEREEAGEDAAEESSDRDVRPDDPTQDPAFQAFERRTASQTSGMKRHPPAGAAAQTAQAAAQPPANDVDRQAKAHHVEEMAAARPAPFDREGFIAAVREAIERRAPKNLEQADEFADSGKAEEVKGEVVGQVSEGKEASEKEVRETTEAPPDTSVAEEKPVTPLEPPTSPPKPREPGAGSAMPDPAPPQETDLSAEAKQTDAMMSQADVTEEQLLRSNEPAWQEAVDTKREGERHSREAPAAFREEEQEILGGAREQASSQAQRGLASMATTNRKVTGAVATDQEAARSQDEEGRRKVADEVNRIYDETEADVRTILDGLDSKVATTFDEGERSARTTFERVLDREMRAWKARRYGGFGGGAKWAKDKLLGLPDSVQRIFDSARAVYIREMDAVIGAVADVVGAELTRAKERIAEGRQRISDYVSGLPDELQAIGREAQRRIAGRFQELEGTVEEKRRAVVDDVAQRYTEARSQVDERLEKLKEESKGLWGKVKDKVGGAIETISRLKDMLLNVLQRAKGAVGRIIRDPIGFLGNLVKGVKSGLTGFVSRIGKHLKKALMGWLFGTLASAGIDLPEKLDLKGVIKLVLQVMGLTWANIRARLTRQLGEETVDRMEKTVDTVQTLVTEGPSGLWEQVAEKVSGLKEMVLDKIQDFLIVKVIKAGVTWVLSLLNPAAAFIKACKMIVSIVRFFIDRGRQIWQFVRTILDSIGKIASGAVRGVANAIEKSLSGILPLVISFFANLLGLGGIAGKIKKIIERAQRPVNRAMDWVIGKVVRIGKKIRGKLAATKLGAKARKMRDKGQELVEKGKAKGYALKARAEAKFEKAKTWAKGKVRSAVEPGAEATPPSETAKEPDGSGRSDRVLEDVRAAVGRRLSGSAQGVDDIRKVLTAVRARFRPTGLDRLQAVRSESDPHRYDIVAAASPAEKVGEVRVEREDTGLSIFEEAIESVRLGAIGADQPSRFKPSESRPGHGLAPVMVPSVRLSDFAVAENRAVLDRLIDQSPATAAEKSAARASAHEKIDAAATTRGSDRIYYLLKEAAKPVKALYGGHEQLPLEVDHRPEVRDRPDIAVRERIERVLSRVESRIAKGKPKAGTPEEDIVRSDQPRSAKLETAQLYVQQLVDREIGDVGVATGPAEVDSLIIPRSHHSRVTQERAARS